MAKSPNVETTPKASMQTTPVAMPNSRAQFSTVGGLVGVKLPQPDFFQDDVSVTPLLRRNNPFLRQNVCKFKHYEH
jgi:hypothetical protein